MSARIYQLLSAGDAQTGLGRRRVWVESNVPLMVADGVVMRVLWDRYNWRYLPRVIVQAPQARCPFTEQFLITGEWIDLTRWAGLIAIPRAVERDSQERPVRYLLEFVAMREGVRLVQ